VSDKNSLIRSIVLASVLLLSASLLVGMRYVYVAEANPYGKWLIMGEVSPKSNTNPPVISILAENDTVLTSDKARFFFNTSVNYSGDAKALYFTKIFYKSDWQNSYTPIYEYIPETGMPNLAAFNASLFFPEIPEGNHTITIFATERGRYEKPDPGYQNPDPNQPGFITLYYFFST
jgi:hypothetical protein